MKDKVINWLINVRAKFIFLFNILVCDVRWHLQLEASHYDSFSPEYEKSFNSNYIRKAHHGNYHPQDTKQWYDPSAVKITNRGLELSITSNRLIDGPVEINTGVGMVTSTFNLSYGLYEWNIRLPKGKLLWPAVWMINNVTWPPEIDVLEGYTNTKGKYRNRLTSAIHVSETPNVWGITIEHGRCLDKTKPLNLKCLWLKDEISIYYNDVLVRRTTDQKVLYWLNKNPWMRIIMNNAIIRKPYSAERPMIVEYFIHYKLKNT